MRSRRWVAALGVGIVGGIVAVGLVIGGGGGQPPTATTSGSSHYLFDDEFNGPTGSKPSSSLWNAKAYRASSGTVWDGWRNISENGQGDVVITARKVNGLWYSGFLSGKRPYLGPRYVEVRARVATGYGVWNAPLWEWDFPLGARGVEDDVIEQFGRQPQTYRTTLHAGTTTQKGFANETGVSLSAGFHTYAARVLPGRVDYSFDGRPVRTIRAGELGGNWGFVTTPMVSNISLNMGGLAGSPTVRGPVSLLVDWIRVEPLPR